MLYRTRRFLERKTNLLSAFSTCFTEVPGYRKGWKEVLMRYYGQ